MDAGLVCELAASHDLVVTLEDNAVQGGAGSAVLECLAAGGMATSVLQLGIPDRYVEHGTQDEQYADCGIDAAGIIAAIRARLA
jgi:1-deoxy-D-xylulose-5-phosphate synthase